MEKDIEIEIRGPLCRGEFDKLVRFLGVRGEKTAEKERVLIDYSTFLEGGLRERKKDIRLRVTNGIPEIIVKIGRWGEGERRRELSVTAGRGEFDKLVEIFGALGFQKGILATRRSKVFEYRGIEFALVEVPNHSYYYEAEKMASKNEDADTITEEITGVCKELGLAIFSREQFFQYIDQLNREANEVFDYTKYTPGYFRNRFKL